MVEDKAAPPAWPGRRALAKAKLVARNRLKVWLVEGDLSDLEQRLVRELEASGRERDRVDDELRHAQAEASAVVATLDSSLADLGAAISREHGLAGAAGAFREWAYLLHELRREVRAHVAGHPEPAGSAVAVPAASGADAYAGKRPSRFDYVGFERRFRGDPEDVKKTLVERYLPLLTGAGPVVDIGCGRGELLEALRADGTEVMGVEPEPSLAAQTRARGVPVVEALGADYLNGLEDGSLGAVVAFHVVEHLIVDDLIELLELSARKLRPGGLFIAETPNPMTFLTLHESYLLDPTHVQPLHPALLSWLAEGAGFRSVEVAYHSPATTLQVPPLVGEGPLVDQLDEVFARLNHQLYGPQDYSLIART